MNTKNHEHIMRILVDLIEFNGNLHDTVSGLLIEEKLPHIITDLAQFIKNNNCFVDKDYVLKIPHGGPHNMEVKRYNKVVK